MLHIEINTKKQILELFKDSIFVKKYLVAVGKPSTPTPLGHWEIIKKGLYGEQFGGDFMQLNIPGGIYGIHGTDLPLIITQEVSPGCVRMYSDDARDLYNILTIGTAVNIY